MAQSSFELILVAVTIGIAAWSGLIGSPSETIDDFDNMWLKMIASDFFLISGAAILLVFIAVLWGLVAGLYSGELGVGGTALYLVILAISIAAVPRLLEIARIVFYLNSKSDTEFNRNQATIVRVFYFVVLLIFILVGLQPI